MLIVIVMFVLLPVWRINFFIKSLQNSTSYQQSTHSSSELAAVVKELFKVVTIGQADNKERYLMCTMHKSLQCSWTTFKNYYTWTFQ